MSKLNVVGNIDKVLAKQEGVSKAGNEWQKISFILKTDEKYNNVYHFEVFGEELVSEFLGFEIGSQISVHFNVKTSEYKERYYSTLSVWSFKSDSTSKSEKNTIENPINKEEPYKEMVNVDSNDFEGDDDDLPF